MKIVIGNDHAAVELKNEIVKYLLEQNYTVINLGTDSEKSVDYPDYGFKVAKAISDESADMGIVICGSGIGISIAANRVKKIRCALCTDVSMAILARKHNNANILALGARFISVEKAKWIVDAFLKTEFEQSRHEVRVRKLDDYNE